MILHEIHTKRKSTSWNDDWDGCKCSYCHGSHKLHFGLNVPQDWSAWNSWYIIKYWKGRYVRWTNSWLKIFKKK